MQGVPVPAGRPRTDFTRKRVYEPKANARYRKLVQKAWDEQFPGFEPIAQGVPIRVSTVFFLPRPKTHYRANGALKGWAPRFHTSENSDFDNLAKLVCDALTGRAWYGDGQIAEGRQRKLYVNERYPEPCTVLTVELLAG